MAKFTMLHCASAHMKCWLLMENALSVCLIVLHCAKCMLGGVNLLQQAQQQTQEVLVTPVFDNTTEKKGVESLRARLSSAERKIARLSKKIEAYISSDGIEVDDDLHQGLSKIMEDSTQAIHEQFQKGLFRRLFWEQQREAVQCSPSLASNHALASNHDQMVLEHQASFIHCL